MYYLILSWSQCIDKLADNIETGNDCCPICYDQLKHCKSMEEILEHMRRCYSLHKIKRSITDDMTATTKINVIKSVVEDVEEEIDNYIIKRLLDYPEE